MPPAQQYAVAAALTLAVELPVYVACAIGLGWARWPRAVVAAAGVNLVTHPLLYAVTLHRGSVVLWLAEVVATLVESALLTWWWQARPVSTVLAVALVANGLSFVVGGAILALVRP
ncbi:MAG: hypothetical protein ABI083_06900 [Lapillicoccus sp.]